MHASIIAFGADAPNAALTLNRIALGIFFAISGYHKLFNASRHATLTRTLQDDGCAPCRSCNGSCPVLYLPGALHCVGLAIVMLAGPGPWSLDALIAARLAN
jgi:uncharacterized membrane protein YphA (DoxX/SURF4 family)